MDQCCQFFPVCDGYSGFGNVVHLLLLTDFDNFGIDSNSFCDSETIKAIFEFIRCTVFEIFEVKDHLWSNATLRNFNETKICKKNRNELNSETQQTNRFQDA
ncbi:hypothetical protein BLOT_014709 [Blomia tropicalis]|nr:hypothetical protein BLOT_014709 [Blomia tropicalis]